MDWYRSKSLDSSESNITGNFDWAPHLWDLDLCAVRIEEEKSIVLSSLGKNKHIRKFRHNRHKGEESSPDLCAKVMGILHLVVSLFLLLAPSQWREGVFVCLFFKAIEGCRLLEDVITMLAIGLCSALLSFHSLQWVGVGLEGGAVFPFSYPLHAWSAPGQFPGAHSGQWSRRQSQGPVCILSPGLRSL